MTTKAENPSMQIPMTAGVTLLMTVVATYVIGALSLAAGIALGGYDFILGFIAAAAAAAAIVRPTRIQWCAGAGAALLFTAASVAVALSFYDYSYDGNSYHQEIIAMLMQGWRPLYGFVSDSYYPTQWAIHYPKGIEITQASVALCLNAIEAGKAINYLLIGAVFGLSLGFMETLLPAASAGAKICVAAIAALNPICIAQSFSYYIDYVLYCLMLFSIVAAVLAVKEGKSSGGTGWWWVYAGVIILSVDSKFNFAFFQALFGIIFLIWASIFSDRGTALKVLWVSAAAALVALLLAWHPYMENWIYAGHPLHPLMGAAKEDIMTDLTPDIYLGHNRVVNFFISLCHPSLPHAESRFGGFGPLMPLMLLLSLWMMARSIKRFTSPLWFVMVSVIISCFIFAQTWWARYIPQLWLLLPAAGYVTLRFDTGKAAKRYLTAQSIMVALTAVMTVITGIAHITACSRSRDAIFRLTAPEATIIGVTPQVERQFAEHDIRLRVEPDAGDADTLRQLHLVSFYGSRDDLWAPKVVLDKESYRQWCDEIDGGIIYVSNGAPAISFKRLLRRSANNEERKQ